MIASGARTRCAAGPRHGVAVTHDPAVTHPRVGTNYVEATAEWMFGAEVDTGEVDSLVTYIASAAGAGRIRTEISFEHFQRNRKAREIKAMLAQLLADGRVRHETDKSHPGAPVTRYFA